MDSTTLYVHILGLSSPWRLTAVDLDSTIGEDRVRESHCSEDSLSSPTCGVANVLHDHPTAHRWRNLDSCQMQNLLICSIPCLSCSEDQVQQLSAPWEAARLPFTLLSEALVIELLMCSSRRRAAKIIGSTEVTLADFARQAVERGRARKALDRADGTDSVAAHLSIDETYRHRRLCATVVGNAMRGLVEEMLEGNSTARTIAALNGLGEALLSRVARVSMDMHRHIETAGKDVLDKTRIVFDSVHFVNPANVAMEQVRLEDIVIHKRLEDPKGATFLKKIHYSLLTAASRQKERPMQTVRLHRPVVRQNRRGVPIERDSSPVPPVRHGAGGLRPSPAVDRDREDLRAGILAVAREDHRRPPGRNLSRVPPGGHYNTAAESFNADIQAMWVKAVAIATSRPSVTACCSI